tara:strand:+ start:5843 stop:6700 length:858 start_codon:yes stop_codon:yes gene_type:complete
MFDSIKESLTKAPSSGFKDVLRFKPGVSCEVRLLPNLETPSETFHHYFSFGWESFATGQYINVVSPQSIGDRCPLAEARYQLRQRGSADEQAKAAKVMRREQWLVNTYVISNSDDSDAAGSVKILRYGKQLHKIITDAIEGEDSDQFGAKVFDLSDKGCSFRVRCDKQGDYPTYVASKFLIPGPVPGLTSSDTEGIYKQVHSLNDTFPIKSYDEIQEIVNEHLHCRSTTSVVVDSTLEVPSASDNDITEDVSWESTEKSKTPKNEKTPEPEIEIPEDLLEGLEDL